MSDTPIFDQIRAEHLAVHQAGVQFGKETYKDEVLTLLKGIAKHGKQVLDLITKLEN